MAHNSSEGDINLEGGVKGVSAYSISGTTIIQNFTSHESEESIRSRRLIHASPYLGLTKFETKDKDKFFGREKWITELSDRLLKKDNVLLLLGASGSGKSSLIRAGLIPNLEDNWGSFVNLTFQPDQNPFESLYMCLACHCGQSKAGIARTVEEDTLIKVVKSLKQDAKWLIFIDQFEELFTTTQKLERDKFVGSLVQLISQRDNSVKIVLTMRADFLDRFNDYPALGTIHNQHNLLLTKMSDDELALAIAEPAARNGVTFEKGLVDQIIRDFSEQDGSLPLLEYTLDLLWNNDDITDRVLNNQTYKNLGGVRGALNQQATKIYNELDDNEKEATQQIFLELIDIAGKEPVSRRSDKCKFLDGGVKESALNKLIDNRLLASGGQKDTPTVEVAHEQLLRSWDVLKDLIRDKEDIISLRSRLSNDANQWHELRKKDEQKANDELWGGSKLEQVLEFREKQAFGNLDEAVNQFIDASVAKRESDLRDKEKQIQDLNLALTESQLREKAARGLNIVSFRPINGLVLAIQSMGENLEKLPGQPLSPVQRMLHKALETVREKNAFRGHESSVTSVAFSPDGQMIVSGSWDKTVRLWDITGNPIAEPFPGHENFVSSVAFSPDGQMIVSGSYDGTVRLWDITGNPIAEPFPGHESSVSSVAFSPDGQMIVSGSDDNTVRLWDIRGNALAEPFPGHESFVNSVAFSPDGQMIVSGSTDNTVRLWDIRGNALAEPFPGHESFVSSVAFSPDGQMIVSGSDDNTVRLWDITGNALAEPFSGHESSVSSVAFSPDGQMIVSGSDDNTVRLWDITGHPIAEPFPGHESSVSSVAFSPDGQMIVSGSHDNTVRLWDITVHPIAEPFPGHESSVYSVAFSPDGQMIVSGSDDKTVRLWDITGHPIAEPFQGHESSVYSVAFSSDGQMIVSGSHDNTVRLWDITGYPIAELFQGHENFVISVAFSPDGQMIVSSSDDNTVRLWDITGYPIAEPFPGHESSVISVAFSPDGQMIVSGSTDGTVRLWDITGNPIAEPFQGHESSVYSVAFSPDGQMIVSGSHDNTVRLWDIRGNALAEPFQGHESSVNSVAFSPDGQMIVSGSHDNTVRLWDIRGNALAEPFQGHESSVSSVAFSPDGQMIVSGSHDKTVRLWQCSWQVWLQACCDRLRDHSVFKNPKDGSEAEAACKTCQTHVWNPRAEELNQQGVAKLKEKAFQAAIEDFNQAIQLNPNHTGAYCKRGFAYAKLKEYQRAIEDFTRGVGAGAKNADVHYYRGFCYDKLGNQQAAVEDVRKAAELYQQQGQAEKCQKARERLSRFQ